MTVTRVFSSVFASIPAFAHGVHEDSTFSLAQTKWAWDLTLLFFLLIAILYIRGLSAYRGHAPVAPWQKKFFFSGIAILMLAYLPPVDTYADQLFSVHMVQHLMITSLGVPLLIMGSPFIVCVRGMPLWLREGWFAPLVRHRLVRGWSEVVSRPLAAVLGFEFTIWFWHIPFFYDAALLNNGIHLLEHACMAFAAINLWTILIAPAPRVSPLPYPLRILALGLMATLDMALSAALTYSPRVWYAYDHLPMPGGWGWSRLEDQQMGGLIMWVPGSAVWMFTMGILFVAWFMSETGYESSIDDVGVTQS
jgi:cytochrome c oxidase assembly factor CtaG